MAPGLGLGPVPTGFVLVVELVLAGLTPTPPPKPRPHRLDPVHHDAPFYVLRRSHARCRMAVQDAENGTDFEVGKLDGLQKRIAAKVVRFPFDDPDKTRPRS